jgi:hypothetical protein
MKSFNKWLEQRKMNEGLLPFIGANHMGPLGYQIGRSLEKSIGGNSRPSSSGVPYRYDKDEDDKKPWYQKDLMQYVPGTLAHRDKKDAIEYDTQKAKEKEDMDDLISKGWDPQDASYYYHHVKHKDQSSDIFQFYKKKYPNYFARM